MHFMNLNKTRQSASMLWKSLVGTSGLDRGYDPYEREPMQQVEIAKKYDLSRHAGKAQNFTKSKNLKRTKLREILYPPNHA